MKSRKSYDLAFCAFTIAAITFSLAVRSQAQTETILHQFRGGRDGGYPYASIVFDAAGNIYGTTTGGGNTSACSGGCGVVFKLSPTSTGGWTETVLHAFAGNYMGNRPGSGVILDGAGNLYGVTIGGGFNKSVCGSQGGCGIVYELSPTASGGYKEKVLHAFTADSDGYSPDGNLVFDTKGNLYGTTLASDTGYGTVYELSPNGSGGWTESILVNFSVSNGANPGCALVFDAAGNLYGSTQYGGANSSGLVFELSPGSGNTWTETILYSFGTPPDVEVPNSVTFDAAGNLYGSAALGGANSSSGGGVFQLVHSVSAPWPENVLYSFSGLSEPFTNVAIDSSGNLYASAPFGGAGNDGNIIEISPSSSGWIERTFWDFNGTNGQTPNALTLDAASNIYGVTTRGGSKNYGVVFEIKP